MPALGDGPDDERLAPATITGRENSRNARAELARLRLDVGTRILKVKLNGKPECFLARGLQMPEMLKGKKVERPRYKKGALMMYSDVFWS